MRKSETAIFIDGPNVYATAKVLGFDMDYKLLLEYYRKNTDLLRAYYYTAVRERGIEHDPLRPLLDWTEYNGYTLVQKPTKEWENPNGGRPKIKGNMDMEMACDAFDLSHTIRNAVFFTGDGDFKALVLCLQRRGIHVTIASSIKTQPSMCSDELRRVADEFIELADLNNTIRQPDVPKGSKYA